MPRQSKIHYQRFGIEIVIQTETSTDYFHCFCFKLQRDCNHSFGFLVTNFQRLSSAESSRTPLYLQGVLNPAEFVKTSQIHNYRTRSVSSESSNVKFSRTDKMYAFFSRIGTQIWNSIPYSIKLLKRSSFRKKIKELLLNFLRSEDDYVEVSCLIKLFNTLG